VEAYSDTVTRILLLRCRQTADAEDCYQEVFLKLLTTDTVFQDGEHLKAWLIRVALNQANSLDRQFWRRRVTLTGDSPFPKDAVVPGSDAQDTLEALRTLPAHQREALYLHCVEGYSVEETAQILRVRPGTVKSRLSRARRALKSKLEEVF
jgi:RNA polymerase sigma-70 factor (ECF subfamily)